MPFFSPAFFLRRLGEECPLRGGYQEGYHFSIAAGVLSSLLCYCLSAPDKAGWCALSVMDCPSGTGYWASVADCGKALDLYLLQFRKEPRVNGGNLRREAILR